MALFVFMLTFVAQGALRGEVPESALARVFVWVVIAVAGCVVALNSKCPACRAWLNAVYETRFCSQCGVPLK